MRYILTLFLPVLLIGQDFYPGRSGGTGTGTVTSVDGTASAGVETVQGGSVAAITTAGTVRGASLTRAVTGTTDTILDSDRGKLVTYCNVSAIAVTLPQAGAGGNFVNGWYARFQNVCAGTVTITPTTSTIESGKDLVLRSSGTATISSDGSNYATSAWIRATPADVSSSPGTTAAKLWMQGPNGGNTTIATTGAGGVGGYVDFRAGSGGVANSAATASIGGAGGFATVVGGDGGAASVSGATRTGGAGGFANFVSGNGGDATGGTDAVGGEGGTLDLTTGNGGNASGASGTNTGAKAGRVDMTLGTGGFGATATGNDGVFRIIGGQRNQGPMVEAWRGNESQSKWSLSSNLYEEFASGQLVQWSNSATNSQTTKDSGLARNAAGVLEVNSGTAGTFRDLKLRHLIATDYSDWTEIAASGSPAASTVRVYAKAGSGELCAKSSAGVETCMSSGAGGSNIPALATYTVGFASLTAAATTQDISLFTKGVKQKICGVTIKHTTEFTGSFSSLTVDVGSPSAGTEYYASAFDIMQATGDTVYQDTDEFKSATEASEAVNARFTSVGANLNTAGAGSVDITVCQVTRP